MKRCYNYLVVIVIAITIASCSSEDELFSEYEDESQIMTRSLSFNKPSISNPTLHSDWENVTKIYLNNGPSIDAPWVFSGGNNMNIASDFRADIKKKDGWKLLSHTMIERDSGEPNYIIFYNKKTGILKVFYYQLIGQNNNNLVWSMESVYGPTSIFPSNQRLQGTLNSQYQYASTSNALRGSMSAFGALSAGWNAFSFELVYGSVNNKPIVRIKGHNDEHATFTGSGAFSGNISIEVPDKSKNPFDIIKDKISPLTKFIPYGGEALTILSAIKGFSSVSEPVESYSTIRGTVSGKTQIKGEILNQLSGAVASTDDIDLTKINNNENLGLWNLLNTPEFKYSKYQRVFPQKVSSSYVKFYTDLYLSPYKDLSSLVVINPSVKNLIKSYRIIDYKFTYTSPISRYVGGFKLSENCYLYERFSASGGYTTNANDKMAYIVTNYPEAPDVTITVEFTYNDGSKFTSSRTYATKLIPDESRWAIDNAVKEGYNIMYVSGIVWDKQPLM